MSKKELYVAPELEVLELRLEGVIAVSGNLGQDGLDKWIVGETEGGSWN